MYLQTFQIQPDQQSVCESVLASHLVSHSERYVPEDTRRNRTSRPANSGLHRLIGILLKVLVVRQLRPVSPRLRVTVRLCGSESRCKDWSRSPLSEAEPEPNSIARRSQSLLAHLLTYSSSYGQQKPSGHLPCHRALHRFLIVATPPELTLTNIEVIPPGCDSPTPARLWG